MTEAIFGLVGVLLGGVISGGATYVLSRRSDRLEARASARLLQGELHLVAHKLHLDRHELERGRRHGFRPANERPKRGDRRPSLRTLQPLVWLGEFSLEPWREHQGRLARVLDSDDWYALSRAYAAIVSGQELALIGETERELLKRPAGTWAGSFVGVEQHSELVARVEGGSAALARLAGADLTESDLLDPAFQ